MADGAARFRQDSSGPALLRVPLPSACLRVRAFHPLRTPFPKRSTSHAFQLSRPYNPWRAVTPQVWAPPRSLATTWGIIVIFSSSGYLDVSVHRVCPLFQGIVCRHTMGCPIRKSPDQRLFAPPRSLSQLVTSFVASESQGIPCTLLVTYSILYSFLLLSSAPVVSAKAVKLIFFQFCQRTFAYSWYAG